MNLRLALLEGEIRQDKAALERAKGEVNHLTNEQGKLVNRVSREVNMALTLIIGPLDCALQSGLPKELHALLCMARVNGQRLSGLGERLDCRHENAKTGKSDCPAINILPHCHFVVATLQGIANRRGTRLELLPSNWDEILLDMEGTHLQQMLMQLLGYVIQQSPGYGWVRLDVFVDEYSLVRFLVNCSRTGKVELKTVQDSNSDNSQWRKVGELVATCGGQLADYSKQDGGHVYEIALPLSCASSERQCQPWQSKVRDMTKILQRGQQHFAAGVAAAQWSELINVLLIESDGMMRGYLQQQLTGQYSCLATDDFAQAMTLAQQLVPDLIIADAVCTDAEEQQWIKAMKSNPDTCHIPLLMICDSTVPNCIDSQTDVLIDGFMLRPFSTTQLLVKVDSLILNRRLACVHFQHLPDDELTHCHEAWQVQPQDDALGQAEILAGKQAFAKRVWEVLERCYAEPEFDVQHLATAMATSKRHLTRRMKVIVGDTPGRTIRRFRMCRAAQLLAQGTAPQKVAEAVGFASGSYFARQFFDTFHCPPEQYCQALKRSGKKPPGNAYFSLFRRRKPE